MELLRELGKEVEYHLRHKTGSYPSYIRGQTTMSDKCFGFEGVGMANAIGFVPSLVLSPGWFGPQTNL